MIAQHTEGIGILLKRRIQHMITGAVKKDATP